MADDQQGQKSAGLTLNLPSNNPFRNNAASPIGATSPASPFDDPPPRPLSRNPFLDPALTSRSSLSNIRSASETMPLEKRPSLTAEEIFGSLTLDEIKAEESRPDAPKPAGPPPSGARRGPPPPNREGGGLLIDVRSQPPNHRRTRSQEDAHRARRAQEKDGRGDRGDRRDPDRSPRRRHDKPPLTEEERKQRESKRRERERRHREKPLQKRSAATDLIDGLDQTAGGIFFHHDGPYDAVNRHRNKEGSRRAPMQAFPEGSLNNTLGGAGPLNARPDHAAFMGQQDDEAFKEWSRGGKERSGADFPTPRTKDVPVFDPLSRGHIEHGDESLGLGTSTFLEGTPAARAAIQKREEERAAEGMKDGLQRKKSLAHRIRNINRGGREFQPSGRVTNPETGFGSQRSPSQGGPASASLSERNPFFSEYNNGKGEDDFAIRRTETNDSNNSPTSPRSGPGLERRSTTDATGGGGGTGEDGTQPKVSGILGRMKSLKGRRQRPAPAAGDAEATPVPGSAV